MESLALIVGIILGSALLNLIVGVVFSFIRKKWAQIVTIISAILSTLLGVMLAVEADGNNNQLIMASILIVVAVFSFANILRRRVKNDSGG
jgi:hypothetical protein